MTQGAGLDLREDPECAIMAAMDYAKANLAQLRAKGYAVDSLNDVEQARLPTSRRS